MIILKLDEKYIVFIIMLNILGNIVLVIFLYLLHNILSWLFIYCVHYYLDLYYEILRLYSDYILHNGENNTQTTLYVEPFY